MIKINKTSLDLDIKNEYDYEIGDFFPIIDIYPLNKTDQEIIDKFHKLYFKLLEKRSGLEISWLGYSTGKMTTDLWTYQEIITKQKPELIIECGTYKGGSTLFLASMCMMIGVGKVITIDKYPKPNRPKHKLIEYVNGGSTDTEILEYVKSKASSVKNILVILDSDHSKSHVHSEILAYKDLVPVGGYLIVEDTFLNGHPSHSDFGPGPMEAVDKFLKNNDDFIIDRSCEHFLATLNPRGYLKKVK